LTPAGFAPWLRLRAQQAILSDESGPETARFFCFALFSVEYSESQKKFSKYRLLCQSQRANLSVKGSK